MCALHRVRAESGQVPGQLHFAAWSPSAYETDAQGAEGTVLGQAHDRPPFLLFKIQHPTQEKGGSLTTNEVLSLGLQGRYEQH